MSGRADDEAGVYADGVNVGWIRQHTSTTVHAIPSNMLLLAFYAQNNGGGDFGVIISLSSGYGTGSSWKCTGSKYPGWETPAYNDAHWPSARVLPKPASWPEHHLDPAQIIWTEHYTQQIWCRGLYSK